MAADPQTLSEAINDVWSAGPDAVEKAVKTFLGTTEAHDFLLGAQREAEYQRTIWQDGNKGPAEWFWTLGYLASKVVHRDEPPERRQHHITAAAGLLANWHAFVAVNPTEQGHTREGDHG